MMWRFNHWLCGAVVYALLMLVCSWLDLTDQNRVDEVDCSTPLKAGHARVDMARADGRDRLRCKS